MPKRKRSVGHIQKLDGDKYLLRLSCGFDEFGKRLQPSKVIHCNSDTEAEKTLMEFYMQREKAIRGVRSSMPQTLQQLYEEWMTNHVNRNCTEKTRSFYDGIWKNYIADKGKVKLSVITPHSLYSILDSMKGDRLKNAAYKMLNAMFNKAIKWGYISHNPCDRIDTPRYHAPEKQPLSNKQLRSVMQNLTDEELKYQAIFYFAVLCGLRRQEILGLTWADINFEQDCFHVRRAATEKKGAGTVTKGTKTKRSERELFLPLPLKEVLLKYQAEQEKQRQIMGDKWHNENWVFTQYDGKLMNLQTPSHWWKDFSERIHVTGVTFHGLRHTAASYMIKNNVPITTVASVLGHSNTSTTVNIYSHMLEDTKKDAINVMAEVLSEAEQS